MKRIKVLIVEDELIIGESMSHLLKKVGYEVTHIAMSAEEALLSMDENLPDIALLDIQIKGNETGIWLGDKINQDYKIPFIYLTSHGDGKTVREAVRTMPSGYLIKPIEQEGLYATIETALYNFSVQNPAKTEADDLSNGKQLFCIKDALFIKDEYLLVKMKFGDLLFVKAQGNYVELASDDKKQLIKGTLKDIANTLPEESFFQIHRSYIINVNRIDSIGFSYVQLGQHQIPIGKDKREVLIEHLQRYS